MISGTKIFGKRAGAMLLVGTILGAWSGPLLAQAAPAAPPATAPATTAAPAPAQLSGVIRSIAVRGNERLEPETVRSYANLSPGQTYTPATLDTALKDLYATELFTDVVITGAETGNLVITVRENPVINRIVLEGNKRLKSEKILPEIKLAPRQIFTRSKVRTDVERIVELYRREGRFAARVEPKIVQLDQNRVDLVFEIFEGDKSKVRRINIIGNNEFPDDRLRKEMYTRQAGGPLGFMKSNDSYDPDRLAADQQKLRAFYLTQGYADFRVVSALAELTPDRRDFIITYVVEEGARYKFGTVEAESALRDMTAEKVKGALKLRPGTWFNAKAVEDAVTDLTELAGNSGYAFADINPAYDRDVDKRLMNITFRVGETPRVYVERINIQGNTVTRDKVIRREFRLNEGDAFSAIKVKRSQDRLQSLGFFQDKLEIKQTEGSAPDRIVLGVDVEEKSTGELQLSGGYSSLERFVLQLSVAQRNFMGKGQELNAGINYSRYSQVDPAGLCRALSFRQADPARRRSLSARLQQLQLCRQQAEHDLLADEHRHRSAHRVSGHGVRTASVPATRWWSTRSRSTRALSTRIRTAIGPLGLQCDPVKAGRYLCDEIGSRVTSLVGYSLLHDDTNGIRPTRGQRMLFSQDFAGLGGDVKYLRTRADATKYKEVRSGWVASAHVEGRLYHPADEGTRAQAATRSESPTASSGRNCAASISAGSALASSATAMTLPAIWTPRASRPAMPSAAALITWAAWNSRFRSARQSAAWDYARRHLSTLARYGRW